MYTTIKFKRTKTLDAIKTGIKFNATVISYCETFRKSNREV